MKKGWQTKRLGDIASVSAGNSAPQEKSLFNEGTYPFFRTADAGRVRFGDIYKSADYLNEKGIKGLRRYPKGAILFPKSGASTFLNHRVMLGVEGYVSSHLATIVADNTQIEPRFLLYFLSTVAAQDLVQDHAYPSLNLPTISDINIQAPPLPEQQRIVGILDEAFADIATAKANAEKNLQNANAIFQSHLNTIFFQRDERWIQKKLNSITSKIGSGATPRGGAESYKAEGISLIRSLNVHDLGFRYPKLAFIDDTQAKELSNVRVQSRDILLNITGASVARCCIVPEDVLPARVNQHVSIIRPIADDLNADFLHYLLISKPYKDRLLQTGKEGGSTRQAITKAQIQEFAVKYPATLKEQKTIVAKLDALLADTQQLANIYECKLTALEELKKSLLHDAFRGAL